MVVRLLGKFDQNSQGQPVTAVPLSSPGKGGVLERPGSPNAKLYAVLVGTYPGVPPHAFFLLTFMLTEVDHQNELGLFCWKTKLDIQSQRKPKTYLHLSSARTNATSGTAGINEHRKQR